MIKFELTKHKTLWNMIISILHDPTINVYSAADLKREAFHRLHPEKEEPEETCYACEYDEAIADMFTEENRPESCTNCPLIWPDDLICNDDNGLYGKFIYACRHGDRFMAIKTATYIRDCPVKENIETV